MKAFTLYLERNNFEEKDGETCVLIPPSFIFTNLGEVIQG